MPDPFTSVFPASHKELEAALLNNRNDISLSLTPILELICIWAHQMGTNGRSVSSSLIVHVIYLK